MSPAEKRDGLDVHDRSIVATSAAVRHLFADGSRGDAVALSCGRHLFTIFACPPEPDTSTVWHDVLDAVFMRRDSFSPLPKFRDVERAAVLAMLAHLGATWAKPPSRLEAMVALRGWAVPMRWLLRLNDLLAEDGGRSCS